MNKQHKLELTKEVVLILLRILSLPIVLPFTILVFVIASIIFFTKSYVLNGNFTRAYKRISKELNYSNETAELWYDMEYMKAKYSLKMLRKIYYDKRKEVLSGK